MQGPSDAASPRIPLSTVRGFAKIRLSHGVTPLEPAPGLEQALGGPRLLIKRDDCTGFALGGNKCRKLEYIFADIVKSGADVVLTAAGVQSNHCRQTAAAAALCGLEARLLLLPMVEHDDPAYRSNGNVLLDRIYGASIEVAPKGCDAAVRLAENAECLKSAGRKPYIIEFGGSTPLGAQGYVDCALEIIEQAAAMNEPVDHVVLACGSGGTQAGLIAGFRHASPHTRVHGISILRSDEAWRDEVAALALQTAKLAGLSALPGNGDCIMHFGQLGEGYGMPTPAMLEATALAARRGGLLLDPVYTGKAMAGLLELAGRGEIRAGETVVFLHTGGAPGIFAYQDLFSSLTASC